MGLEHSVMRPVARTAAEVFATAAATAATAATAAGSTVNAATAAATDTGSNSAAAAAVDTEGSLFSSSDGQMLLQAMLSFSMTVSKACAGLQGWQWYNWPEKPAAETSPLLLANLALLGVQSQLAVSQQFHSVIPSEDSAVPVVSPQHASSSSGDGGGSSSSNNNNLSGDASSRATGSSRGCCSSTSTSGGGGAANASDTASANTDSGSSSSNSGPSGNRQSFPAAPWQQLLCAAAALTSKMLHVEAGSVSQARAPTPVQGLPTAPAVPSDWLCANLFRVQASGNKALDLLQQHARQLGLPVWEAPVAGSAPVSGGPGSLLWQVQLTCTLLQQWCDWIRQHTGLEGAQAGSDSAVSVSVGTAAEAAAGTAASADLAAAQHTSQQQQQQRQLQQLVMGLQDTVKVLSGQLLPVLSELHKLSEQLVGPKHRCDLDSDDPAQTANLGNAFRIQFSTEFVRFGPSDEEKCRNMAIFTAFQGLPAVLKAASKALAAAVPCSYACNSWGCRNLSTVSEGFALVRGKGCVCGGCLGVDMDCSVAPAGSQSLMAARYCSRECQVAHRQQHQELCGRLQQAATPVASNVTQLLDLKSLNAS